MTICISRSCSAWLSPELAGLSLNSRTGEREIDTLGRNTCRGRVRYGFGCSPGISVVQLSQPSFEKPALGLLPGERDRTLVGNACLRVLAQPPAQVRACRMRQVVIVEIAARQDG